MSVRLYTAWLPLHSLKSLAATLCGAVSKKTQRNKRAGVTKLRFEE